MEPGALSKELKQRGLVILAVGQHHANPEILTVYLHGNAAQWIDGYAQQVVRMVPGVVAVSESVDSPSILLVRVQPDTGTGGE
jgi:hypothetical protein